MYNLKQDGSFHEVAIFDDVLGKIVKSYNFIKWSLAHFRIWSCACGCDYLDNIPFLGASKVYRLVSENFDLSPREICQVISSHASDPHAHLEALWAAYLSFQFHHVFHYHEDRCGQTGQLLDCFVKLRHLTPLPRDSDFHDMFPLPAYTDEESSGVYFGRLHPVTLAPRVVTMEENDANAPALEADFSHGQCPQQYTVQKLKAYLVNRGIPIPAGMSRRDAIIELVEKVLMYPAGTWPIISPWSVDLAGWTRQDPVQLHESAVTWSFIQAFSTAVVGPASLSSCLDHRTHGQHCYAHPKPC